MNEKDLQKIKSIFRTYQKVKLAYFFGSRAIGQGGALSDYDFAVYLKEEMNKKKMFDLKITLMNEIGQLLKIDKVDVVILNLSDSPELNYQIIKNGRLILERQPFKVIVEPRILNKYFDFHSMLLRHNLTKS